uniref:Uncharacterized protein n=1 Tax=Cyclopterus lumpus TaxID=8103 RepID=A0A8C3ASV2_CYCLU
MTLNDLDRRQRQKEQLREWLVQQQSERAAERHQRKLEEQHDDQSSADMRNKALQLQGIEMEQRKAATIATKDYNLATVSHQSLRLSVEVPNPARAWRGCLVAAVPAVIGAHLWRACKLERKRDEEQHDRVRLDSSRTALLIERQQAKVNKQLRRQMDSTNVKMAETHKQQSVALFSQLCTCTVYSSTYTRIASHSVSQLLSF